MPKPLDFSKAVGYDPYSYFEKAKEHLASRDVSIRKLDRGDGDVVFLVEKKHGDNSTSSVNYSSIVKIAGLQAADKPIDRLMISEGNYYAFDKLDPTLIHALVTVGMQEEGMVEYLEQHIQQPDWKNGTVVADKTREAIPGLVGMGICEYSDLEVS